MPCGAIRRSIVSSITTDTADRLTLARGMETYAVVRPTDVKIEVE